MKSNNRTLGRFDAKYLLIAASALATFTFVQPVSAESSVLNQPGVYEQTVAQPAWPHHVEVRFATPRTNGEHPAVIAAREFDEQDYQSQLRLHPAGLALSAKSPQPMSDNVQAASLKPE